MNAYSFRKLLFGISPDETTFAKRGFHANSDQVRQHLENIGETFVYGYHAALLDDHLDSLTQQLNTLPNERRGFAYEGAAMAMTLLDFLSPFNRTRFKRFIENSGAAHIYMVNVGAGWAWARLHRNINKALTRLDPLLGWLALDGYGFHQGYFHWQQSINERVIPHALSGYARRVFDQGIGRSLWFVKGAEIEVIAKTINTFPAERQSDLWSGIGLAATYAGGVDESTLTDLVKLSHMHHPQLAQGAAFAAKARERASNTTPHTVQACQIICGTNTTEAAQITDEALIDLPYNNSEPAYEIWRQRIQKHYL
jgi:enediyne biosynthesis protein E3